MQNKQRSSNIELLRIVAMVMIVLYHIMIHGISPYDDNPETQNNLRILYTFVIYGVDLFVLISGYFGIRLSWRSFINLMWIIAFYKLFHLCADTWFLGISHSWMEWFAKPLSGPVSGGGWFVDVYVLLMLVSPLLNRIKDTIKSRNDYLLCLAPLLLLDCGYGFMLGKHFDTSGFSLMNFITLYMLGYGIREYLRLSGKLLLIIMGIAFVLGFACMFYPYAEFMNGLLYSYSSPLVLLISVCIFAMLAKQNRISNKGINFIAASMFPVYLIHEGGNVSRWFYGSIGRLWMNQHDLFFYYIPIYVLALFLITISVDQLRKYIGGLVIAQLAEKISNIFKKV